uniref:Carboxypeptidase n=1 Tax=Gloeothece verrucosa (strain PCC 7822) TaxID=497965 RepID=E0UJ74_GLOV7|nr:hypothetical protein Cyan7822_3845 [Gloeothece verrucosa PCC 7822]
MLLLVFVAALIFPLLFSLKSQAAEPRQLIALTQTIAYKPVGSGTLTLERGQKLGVAQVNPSGNWWIVDLASRAGRWKVKKEDVDFFYGNYPLDLPNWQGGDWVATIKAIISECKHFEISRNQCAYVIATAEAESNFAPVQEAWWLGEVWRKTNLRYWPWYGRGYVQLTWRFNYLKYERILGIKLTQNPDLASRPDIALYILLHGMTNGSFTGASLRNYINGSKTDYVNARRIINGMDRAGQIAGRARFWLSRLTVY